MYGTRSNIWRENGTIHHARRTEDIIIDLNTLNEVPNSNLPRNDKKELQSVLASGDSVLFTNQLHKY